MACPTCGTDAAPVDGRCQRCGTPSASGGGLSAPDAATAFGLPGPDAVTVGVPRSDAATVGVPAATTGGILPPGAPAPGQPFGTRYHIIRVLGAGGMGVVYHAWDAELGVAVALKVIRPEVLQDAGAAGEVERRFKRELVLARQVTHKNVVRIHDLGEMNGTKYLTMPFVEGEDLGSVLKRRGKLPLPEVLDIARQVAAGLAAAHAKGVVHRDLKPENIMLGTDGEALIMDFGISRSVSGTGTATQLGAVLGTLEYMAPEQAQGQPVDQRADIYSFGLMLYDMLTGRQRLVGRDNPMSEMLGRMAGATPSARAVDPNVPEAVEQILARAMAPTLDSRYQTTADLLRDLEALTPDGHVRQVPGTGSMPVVAAPDASAPVGARRFALPAGIAAGMLVAAGGIAWVVMDREPSAPAGPREPVSVLVANFENQAKDEQFDGLIEQAMAVGIEGTSFVTAFPRRDALRIAQQIAPDSPLNEEVARLISTREGVDVIIAGAISFDGSRYTLRVKAVDPSAPKPLLEWETDVAAKADVLAAVGKGAAEVRSALGDTSASAGDAETFTARTLDAAHAYARAQELTWAGKSDEARAEYEKAIAGDPELGRAYAGLAVLHANAGRRDKAAEYYEKAMAQTSRMTERERLRTRGGYYLLTRNSARAAEEFQTLVEKFPADTAALANLAVTRVYERKMSEALELGRRAAAIYPNNVIRRNNVALFAMYAGEFEMAEQEAREVLKLNPAFAKAYVAIALSQLARGQAADAEATWQKLSGISGGQGYAAAGLADLAAVQGRVGRAAEGLRGGPDGAGLDARRLAALAEAQLAQGNTAAAVTTAGAALSAANGKEDVLFLAGRVLALAGRARADLVQALGKSLDTEPRIYGLLLAGETALARKDARKALEHFTNAQALGDTWLGRYGLGRAYLAAERYPEAESELEKCLARRGEVTAVFLDEIPTYRYLPPVHYYMGLVREGLKNERGATESFQTFLDLKKDGDEQGLVADARRRLGQS